jgi:hypothetical protein
LSTTPLASPSPAGAEARDWAERTAKEHGLCADAAALLADLYVPDLPGLVEEFDREVAALPDQPDLLTWGVTRHKPATGLDHLLERLDDDRLRRVLVWSFTAWPTHSRKRVRAESPDARAAQRHRHVHRHFGNRTPVWDPAALALLIRTAGLGWVPARPLQRALATVDRAGLALIPGELRAVADRLAARLGTHQAEERDREEVHQWLLRVLLDLGHVPAGAEELCYGGDQYFDLLRATHPDLLKAPGVPALMVHHLQPFHGDTWQGPLQEYLDAIGDPADVVRRFLETALALPFPADPAPGLTEEERQRHGYPWNADPRAAAHLTRLARHMLEGMAEVVPFLPHGSAPWAVDLLERLALRMESAPPNRQRASYFAHRLSSVLSRLRTEEAFRAVVRLRDQPGLDRNARKYHQANVAQATRLLRWTPDQMVERSVPDHGLAADGTLTTRVGAFTVVLALTESGTEYTFTGPDGTAVRRAPKALRESHPDELKALQTRAAALRKTLKAERERLAELAGTDRVWSLPDWLRYYLRHPVTGLVAREARWEASADGVAWRSCAVEADGDHWRLVGEDGGTVLFTGRAAPDARVRALGEGDGR